MQHRRPLAPGAGGRHGMVTSGQMRCACRSKPIKASVAEEASARTRSSEPMVSWRGPSGGGIHRIFVRF
jgi:hypothetical protein